MRTEVLDKGYPAYDDCYEVSSKVASLVSYGWLSVILSCIAAIPPTAQEAAMTEAQVREAASGIVKQYIVWGPKLNPPGVELTLKELSRERGKFVYNLYAHGLPRDHTYTIFQWPVTQLKPTAAVSGVTFDESGLAICQGKPGTCGDPASPNAHVNIMIFPAEGEPFRVSAIAKDDYKLQAFAKVVPRPNAAEDKGCRVEAVLLMPHAELILLQASNFPANTRLTMIADSEGEIQKTQPTTDAKGEYTYALMPAKAGLKSGSIKVRLEGPNCAPQVSVPWASAAQPR